MNSAAYLTTAFIMGAVYSIYLPMNSALSRHMGSPLAANIIFFTLALTATILLFLTVGPSDSFYKLTSAPLYYFIPGFLSAFIILGLTYMIPILGPRKTFILTISGQVITAMLVGHLGLFNVPEDPITIRKTIGAFLLLAGVVATTDS